MSETIQPLELLARVCAQRGWALLLVSDADFRRAGKRWRAGRTGSKIHSLVIVHPSGGDGPRWQRCETGDLILRFTFSEDVDVNAAATWIVEKFVREGTVGSA